ncbi:MAG: SprT protein [Paraglaciecola sp.]|jgi:SprT protein
MQENFKYHKIKQRVEQCYAHAREVLKQDFVMPKILFNQRGKIAGSARLQTHELRFNPILLEDNLQLFIDEVVPHEVCHLLTYQLYGRVRPHGRQWKTLMNLLFGLNGTTRHSMDVVKVQGRTFAYFCRCGPIELSIRRHNKIVRHQQTYVCRCCKQTLLVKQTA